MSEKEALHGLGCPNCGGMVPVPEGQVIVQCPYCDLRSMVRGERGLRRFQIPRQVDRTAAEQAMRRFLGAHQAIARNIDRKAKMDDVFLAYLPFWTVWARVLGWAFGEEQVGSGDNRRYVPREVKVAEEMNWNQAACDVGEFGVDQIHLSDQPLDAFDPDALHASGMVFEPVGSQQEADTRAENDLQGRVHQLVKLDRVSQVFTRFVRRQMGLVYYPLWVLRYLYRGRAFQVVVDGYSGEVLYGKAPGNTLYRAAMLVGGMALGAFLAVDASAMAFYFALSSDDGGEIFFIGLGLLAAGFALMGTAYRRFRYGEHFEFRAGRGKRRRFSRRKEGEVYRAREGSS